MELLGAHLGYVWAFIYGVGKDESHVVLVHADGTVLGPNSAELLLKADKECDGSLHVLTPVAAGTSASKDAGQVAEAVEHYRRWIAAECGHIQLDGLPADTDLSAMKMRLEKLFVPLKAVSYTHLTLPTICSV